MTREDYCRKCGKKSHSLCTIKTVSPNENFSKQYKVLVPCVKQVEGFIEGRIEVKDTLQTSLDNTDYFHRPDGSEVEIA